MNHHQRPFLLVLALVALGGPVLAGPVFQDDTEGDEQEPRPGPRLIVDPTSGPVGMTVQLRGAGFADNCGAELYLDTVDGEPLGFARVRKDGSFSTQLSIPSGTPAGKHVLIAQGLAYGAEPSYETRVCGEPSGDTARAGYEVRPAPPILGVSELEGRPGRTVSLEGRGFCAAPGCSAVDILIDGLVMAADVPVGPGGTLSAEAMVPAVSASGEVRIEAIQRGAAGEEIRAFSSLIVTVRPNVRTGPD